MDKIQQMAESRKALRSVTVHKSRLKKYPYGEPDEVPVLKKRNILTLKKGNK